MIHDRNSAWTKVKIVLNKIMTIFMIIIKPRITISFYSCLPSNQILYTCYLVRNEFGLWLANFFRVYSQISRICRFLSSIYLFVFLCLVDDESLYSSSFFFLSETKFNYFLLLCSNSMNLKSEAELIMPNFPYCCIRFFSSFFVGKTSIEWLEAKPIGMYTMCTIKKK